MRTHRTDLLRPAAHVSAIKPLYDDFGRALFYFRHNVACERCDLGGTLIDCSYCNLTWHQTCAGLQIVPDGYFLCPGCVQAENQGQDMADHGAAFEDFDGSESDEDGTGGDGGGWDAGEMFGEAAFAEHGVNRIPGLWEETNAEALRRARVYDCDPIPSTLTPVDMMLLGISKAYGTPLSAMKEFDQVMSCVIEECVDAGLPAEDVPHVFTRADNREAEFKRVVFEASPYVTFQVQRILFCISLRRLWLISPF
jgi:hypothetical protein